MPRTARVGPPGTHSADPLGASFIASWSADQLVALIRSRPDLGTPPPKSLVALGERAVSPHSTALAHRRLDRAAQQLLEVMALVPPPVTAEQAAALLARGTEPEHLERPLALLEESALLLRSAAGWSLNPGLDGTLRRNGIGPPAAALLAGRTAADLAAVCKRLGIAAGKSKDATLGAIAACIAQPEEIRRLLRKAPAGVAQLAEEVARGANLRGAGPWGLTDKTPAGWLYGRGLLGSLDWFLLAMPGEASLAVRGGAVFASFSPDPPDIGLRPAEPAALASAGTEAALAAAEGVATMLDSLAEQPAKLLKDGGIGVRELRRLAKAAGCPERDAARLLDIAVAAGLAWIDVGLDAALPTAAFDGWAASDPPARWGALVAGWYGADYHPSLAGAIGYNDRPIPPLLPRGCEDSAADRRRAALAALAAVPEGYAADAAALSERSRWASPDLWDGGPASPSLLCTWVIEECELLGLSVGGALTEPGRLVASGDLSGAANLLASLSPAITSEIVLQADHTAIAAGTLASEVALELDLLADVESKGAATVYRFSEPSLRRAFDAGRTAEGISGFLARHAPRGVPQSLAYLVGDVGRRHGVARVGSAQCYLRCDEASLLAEMVNARAVKGLALRQLAPTVAITDREPSVVVATLRSAGYLPAAEDAGGGLVVTRPSPRRAPVRGLRRPDANTSSTPLPPGGIEALVEGLRRTSPFSPPAPSKAATPKPRLHAVPPPSELFDDAEVRPSAIVRDRASVMGLFDEAFVEDWVVRVSYTNGKGATSQLNVIVVDVDDDDVVVQAFPRLDRRVLRIDRVEWARMLTEAEEEAL